MAAGAESGFAACIDWQANFGRSTSVEQGYCGAPGQALIHLKELSWDRLVKPEQAVKVGQHLQAVVLNIDRKKGRLNLSVKRMQVPPLPLSVAGSPFLTAHSYPGCEEPSEGATPAAP